MGLTGRGVYIFITDKCEAMLDGGSSRHAWRINSTHTCDGASMPLHNPLMYVNSICAKATCDAQNAEMSVTQVIL